VLKVATESLAHLHLAGSGLGVEGCKSIANAVKFSNVLSTLDLASNGGACTPDGRAVDELAP
jgi:hypothetical protein